MKYKEKLFPAFISVPTVVFGFIWLAACVYLIGNYDAVESYYINMIPVFPGVRNNVFCYPMEKSLSSFLLMLAWLFSFLVLIAVLVISRDYRKVYLRASKGLKERREDKENKHRRLYWFMLFIMSFLVVIPYARYVFGVNVLPIECFSYPGSYLFPGKSFAVDGLLIIVTGEILGTFFSYFIGKTLVKTNDE